KPIDGARNTIAAPIMGKGYIDIQIKREEAARYGISIEDVQSEIETALAGRAVTFTVEKRERFPVRIRYARASRDDEESIRRLLISPRGMNGQSAGMDSAGMSSAGRGAKGTSAGRNRENVSALSTTGAGLSHTAPSAHAAGQQPPIPLSAVAVGRVVEGPA